MHQSRWQEKVKDGTPYRPPYPQRSLWSRPVTLILFVLFLVGLGFAVWWGYTTYLTRPTGPLPIIRAEEGPYKVRPEDPHTHKIPHKEKTIYEALSTTSKGEEKIQMRALPEAPIPHAPTLPTNFIEAFTDSMGSAPDLIGELVQENSAPSPFREAAPQSSPFSEKDQFFVENDTQETRQPFEEGSTVSESLLPSYEADLVKVRGLKIEGCTPRHTTKNTFSMHFCQVSTHEQADQQWRRLRRQAPDLLALHTPSILKVDHGRDVGVRYHLRLPRLDQKEAESLQKQLIDRGVTARLLPE